MPRARDVIHNIVVMCFGSIFCFLSVVMEHLVIRGDHGI